MGGENTVETASFRPRLGILLTGVLLRVDGQSPPKDWMDDSPDPEVPGDKEILREDLELLIALILL